MPKLETRSEQLITAIIVVIITALVTYAATSSGKANASDVIKQDVRISVLEEQRKADREQLNRIEAAQRETNQYIAQLYERVVDKQLKERGK